MERRRFRLPFIKIRKPMELHAVSLMIDVPEAPDAKRAALAVLLRQLEGILSFPQLPCLDKSITVMEKSTSDQAKQDGIMALVGHVSDIRLPPGVISRLTSRLEALDQSISDPARKSEVKSMMEIQNQSIPGWPPFRGFSKKGRDNQMQLV